MNAHCLLCGWKVVGHLDDYNLPGIKRAVSFVVANLEWTVADIVEDRLVVLRTATGPDTRDFRFFAEF